MVQASEFVRVLKNNHNVMVACPEEIAFSLGYIDAAQLVELGEALSKNSCVSILLGWREMVWPNNKRA